MLPRNGVQLGILCRLGSQPDCANPASVSCAPVNQNSKDAWHLEHADVLDTVKSDGQLGNIQPVDPFYARASSGTLPAVSWVVPSEQVSEHPPSPVSFSQSYVTSLVNAVMSSPDWRSTAIFLNCGGFYDHVVPPPVDQNSYGLHVPAMVISPFAKQVPRYGSRCLRAQRLPALRAPLNPLAACGSGGPGLQAVTYRPADARHIRPARM
jgi:hypothetical protein